MPDNARRPYDGIRIIDLTRVLAGPFATMILSDLGAAVIKVEPATGDDSRRLPPHVDGESTVFRAVNRGKRSIVLDLKDAAGRDHFLRLVDSADVVVESFRPGTMDRLGLGFDVLAKRNCKLVHCSISAFGDGPLGRDLPGYDALLQAFSGILRSTGHPGAPPARLGPSAVDLGAGMWTAIQIMAALARRADCEQAQRLEVTLVDTALNLMCHQALSTLATDEPPLPQGSGAPSTAPYEVFHTGDGELMIAAGNDSLFRALCVAIGDVALTEDAGFADMRGRVANREALHKRIEAKLTTDTSEVWTARLRAAGVPVSPVNDLKQALADPLVAERDLLFAAPGRPDMTLMRLPLGDLAQPGLPPPLLGEHTVAIIAELDAETTGQD